MKRRASSVTTTHKECPIKLKGTYLGPLPQKSISTLREILRKFPLEELPGQFMVAERGHSLQVIKVEAAGTILATLTLPTGGMVRVNITLLPRT